MRARPRVIPLRTPDQMPTPADLEWLDREIMPKIRRELSALKFPARKRDARPK